MIKHPVKYIYLLDTFFCKLRKCEILPISKIAQNLYYKCFKNFGSKRDTPLQISCENFIMGSMVGFRAILDQRLAFTTLKNWTPRIVCEKARVNKIPVV